MGDDHRFPYAFQQDPVQSVTCEFLIEFKGFVNFVGTDVADTGKPAGHDLREHKVTLPLIYALPRMSSEQRHQVERLLENPQPTDQEIAGVIQIVADCGGIEYARGRAQSFCAGAEVALGALPPSTAREQLRASLTFVQERRN